LIKFTGDKALEGWYLLITSGEVGHYPEGILAVSDTLLKQLGEEFSSRGITYQRLNPKELNARRVRMPA